MTEERTCLCGHDLIYHGVGWTQRCTAWIFDPGRQCHCAGFRRVVPGAVVPEGDMLDLLRDILSTLRRIEERAAEGDDGLAEG